MILISLEGWKKDLLVKVHIPSFYFPLKNSDFLLIVLVQEFLISLLFRSEMCLTDCHLVDRCCVVDETARRHKQYDAS